VKGVNGDIHAVPAKGPDAEVIAKKHASRSDPASVTIQVIQHPEGVTICAVYPTPSNAREPNECQPGEDGHMSTNNNDVRVDFTVYVPRGVHLEGRTVNGEVDATGLSGNVGGFTVNGGIKISTTGLAEARTVNGTIEASMGKFSWNQPLRFETVNGDIDLEVPAGLSAQFSAETLNGSISSDFDITTTGRLSRRRMTGTIGSGGGELAVKTLNGSIRLRKAA
jgi:DUF4097 and DUF4098 domain-containing protein YvlB